MKKVALVILAAGNSSRMENDIKQLLPWNKTTLLEHTIKEALSSEADAVFVVLGANYEKINSKLNEENYSIINNRNWSIGLGSSIAFAVNHINKTIEKCEVVLIVLADQPFLGMEHYNSLIEAYKKSSEKLAATEYGTKKGVPAIFGKKYFDKLTNLEEDFGAKHILATVNASVIKGNTTDVDTIEVYNDLFRNLKL
ncbi:nucleotidyltransferase family protein [Cellulophaga sp. HaHaR_3_176]|uniref:nucleotidyltransferase family protein n=1 Tax=Cellulophaga sp. HaHaR_3_176 TaxID=1942464 RepID=UPI001C1FE350|nr:nucleotidyltransferase family protein [Cellulophaga sp. HaHaR_3_176]QWX85292.1 nucleotidyltransferase family protein [Cellulophaga sp. HaHaR_3_176]